MQLCHNANPLSTRALKRSFINTCRDRPEGLSKIRTGLSEGGECQVGAPDTHGEIGFPPVRPELVEGSLSKGRSWFDKLTTNDVWHLGACQVPDLTALSEGGEVRWGHLTLT